MTDPQTPPQARTSTQEPPVAASPTKILTNNPQRTYTFRVLCCVLFVFLTEIFLAHYVYRLINSEIRSDYVARTDFRQFFLNEIRSESARDEIARILYRGSPLATPAAAVRTSQRRRRKRSSPSNGNGHHYNNMLTSPNDEAHVEFVNPEFKSMLEAKDEQIRQQTGSKGTAPGGDSWVWLTSYCRIPEKALEGYCKKVHQFCPETTGPPGPIGPKGDRGDKGFPGIPGSMGPKGLKGDRGHDGHKGSEGRPGQDGRDGIPGSPGLDGLPGRNGYDGLSGLDGERGLDGRPGTNGTDGMPGLPGPQGPPGPPGVRGLTGPKGKAGRHGRDGEPGRPGGSFYQINGKNVTEILIPPTITKAKGPMETTVVNEGTNLRLHCSSAGSPVPRITWTKNDVRPIVRGAWKDTGVSGDTLNITNVNRVHMGQYMCTADNGIPPTATHTFNLEVYFPPLVRVENQVVEVVNGSSAVLECETEAFPEPVRFWERSDGRLLENGRKYQVDNSIDKDIYKARMRLNITSINPYDLKFKYYCVSKNELQTTRGELQLQEMQFGRPRPPTSPNDKKGSTFGPVPPELTSEDEICRFWMQCSHCGTETKDKTCSVTSSVSLIDLISRWEVRPFGKAMYDKRELLNRTTNCALYAVGKPVYMGSARDNVNAGCWMRDSNPNPKGKDANKFWSTEEQDDIHLYEFDDKFTFRNHNASSTYTLDYPFEGNAHVIYNGSFYYHAKSTNRIVRFNLHTRKSRELILPISYRNNTRRLYSEQNSFMDFNVDDNGLWVVFPVPESTNTAIMKMDGNLMKVNYIWNVSIDHHKVGEMFIVCGVLYAVDSVSDRTTKIRFAFDLYNENLVDAELQFSNPFRKTVMVAYNYRNRELNTWDRGNALSYPVRYNELAFNSTTSWLQPPLSHQTADKEEKKSGHNETAVHHDEGTGSTIYK